MDCWETVHFFYFISKKPLYLCTQKPEVEDNWSGSWITHVTFRKNSERIPKEFRKNSERTPKELRKNSERPFAPQVGFFIINLLIFSGYENN